MGVFLTVSASESVASLDAPMSALDPYEVYAVKYARNERPKRSDVFLGGDPHDGPMPLDYFIWVVRNARRTYVVDLGFQDEVARRRGRTLTRSPREALACVGVDSNAVTEVLITHLHFDHAGSLDACPKARIHVQQREMHFATGPCMCHASLGGHYEEEDIVQMVRRIFKGQVTFHCGDEEIAPGLSVHHVGGHTDGLQVVRVWTARGWLVLASDAAHFYANMFESRPFTWTYNIGDHLLGFGRMAELAESYDHIIPGHDPLVMAQYAAPSPELEGIVVRLDWVPKFSILKEFPNFVPLLPGKARG